MASPSMRWPNLTGQQFERLTVIEPAGTLTRARGSKERLWLCRCTCGQTTTVTTAALTGGKTRSCGCLRMETVRGPHTHGGYGTPEHRSWWSMIQRCTYPSHVSYPRYGGRGITICERWQHSFPNFLADMGPKPTPDHSIERKDGSLGYYPENCVWASPREQQRNLSSNRMLEFNGRLLCLAEWARETGIGATTLLHRLGKGWTIEATLTMPPTPPGRRRWGRK